MKISHPIAVLLGCLATATSVVAEPVPANPPAGASESVSPRETSRRDRRFVLAVLKLNHDEIVIAQLVAERAGTREVKLLSRQLISDYEKATRDLRVLAEKKSISLPEPRSESNDLKTWNEKNPQDLDVAYTRRAQDALEDLIDLYEKADKKSDDPEFAAFAQRLLTAVQEQHEKVGRLPGAHGAPDTAPAPAL